MGGRPPRAFPPGASGRWATCGIRFRPDGIFLVALHDIALGEEIAWDYSTTVADPDWRMPCACGSAACRDTIGTFATLSDDRQR